jgi:hypothetical protein
VAAARQARAAGQLLLQAVIGRSTFCGGALHLWSGMLCQWMFKCTVADINTSGEQPCAARAFGITRPLKGVLTGAFKSLFCGMHL